MHCCFHKLLITTIKYLLGLNKIIMFSLIKISISFLLFVILNQKYISIGVFPMPNLEAVQHNLAICLVIITTSLIFFNQYDINLDIILLAISIFKIYLLPALYQWKSQFCTMLISAMC